MFRFTIRDAMWLTVVAALGCGWLLDHRTKDRELESIKSVLRVDGTDAAMNQLLEALRNIGQPATIQVKPPATDQSKSEAEN